MYIYTMKATFNLKDFLTANKEAVLIAYEKLTKERFFNEICLKEFMILVMNMMANNNPKSDKRAASLLPTILGTIIFNNSKIN